MLMEFYGAKYGMKTSGTKINYAVVKVSFDNEFVQEKTRPSK